MLVKKAWATLDAVRSEKFSCDNIVLLTYKSAARLNLIARKLRYMSGNINKEICQYNEFFAQLIQLSR